MKVKKRKQRSFLANKEAALVRKNNENTQETFSNYVGALSKFMHLLREYHNTYEEPNGL